MISGLVLKYLNGECFLIRRAYETTLPVSSSFCLTVPYYATGEADFILVVIVKDIAEYEEFTQECFFDESNVSKFTSSIVMDRVKVSLDII